MLSLTQLGAIVVGCEELSCTNALPAALAIRIPSFVKKSYAEVVLPDALDHLDF